MSVIKRDGRKVEFDKQKIVNAILKAFEEVDKMISSEAKEIAENISNHIEKISKKKSLSIEDIQSLVEEKLMATKRKDVARAYVEYRFFRDKERERNSKLFKEIWVKLNASDVQNQNANVDEKSFGGRIGEATNAMMKSYALKYCMSDMARKNHENNEIYIHDLDHYAIGNHNCYNQETAFVTYDGIKKFKELHDGQIVKIIDKDGIWRNATVKKYEKQKMYDLTFVAGLTRKTVTCTRNHRWVLRDGSVTDDIQVGDKLALTPELKNDFILDEKLWCLGFVIGDGCDDRQRITNSMMQVRLCGEKVKYIDRFLKCGWGIGQTFDNGDKLLTSRGNGAYKQIFLDNKIWKILSHNDICNLFNGYMSADGHEGNLTITTSDERIKEFIEYSSAVAGYHLISKQRKIEDTNYKKDRIIYNFKFIKKQSSNHPWKLESICANSSGENGYQVAWCVEEPITHTFTLDGGMVTGNCLSIPFDDLLANGFNTRQTDVRPAQSVSTAFQLVAVIFQLQSLQQFGGVASTHLDWTMVPYVRKSFRKHYIDGLKYIHNINDENLFNHVPIDAGIEDNEYLIYDSAYKYAMDMTSREIYQAVEGMYHNLNTLQSRSGNQLPFTSINYGTCTLPEGRMITKALLDVSIKGIGKLHKTSIFPCGIFQCMKGVNRKEGDPNYDLFKLALRSTAQRLYPNYVNVDWSANAGYDKNDPRTYTSTMGCRTYNGYDINGLGQLKDGRGNLCPVTIILPTLAMEAKKINNDKVIDEFLNILDKKINEAKDMLLERFEYMCKQPPDSAKFMYENNVMAGYVPEEGIVSALKHGTLVIGQLGLAEALQVLIGCDHTETKGMELAKKIESLFQTRCKEFKEEYHLNFGVYLTPAENLAYTAMKKFKEKYGEIENVSDKEFFTNSTHVPVWKKLTPFEKINIETELANYSNAGCITYIELSSGAKNNIEALEKIVNYAMDKDLPYFAINVPNDTCLDCGYCDEFNDHCPICGSENIQQLRRVTGLCVL